MPPYELPEVLQVLILAVIQGIAEFLPISSSGHLVAASALFNTAIDGEGKVAELNIVLHFGTLLAIVVFYRKRIFALLTQDKRVIPLIIVGTIPAVVIGLGIKMYYEWITESPLLTGFMLPVTGFILMVLPKLKDDDSKKDYQEMSIWKAFLIGIAQAFAILPGISRSGSTIVAGSLLGLRQQSAATFSFLLAIPVIAGGAVLEAKDIIEAGTTHTPLVLLLMGAAVACGVGLLALQWLVKWIESGKLHLFAYWVIPLGFALVVWQLYVMANSL
ncbi:MAG: undecaprenyl-diphosphate phosphatase [Planctomycetota bacterium]